MTDVLTRAKAYCARNPAAAQRAEDIAKSIAAPRRGQGPQLTTPKHLQAFEACEEFVRQRAVRGLDTTQAERDEYIGGYEAAGDE
jgi:hypothetical protein